MPGRAKFTTKVGTLSLRLRMGAPSPAYQRRLANKSVADGFATARVRCHTRMYRSVDLPLGPAIPRRDSHSVVSPAILQRRELIIAARNDMTIRIRINYRYRFRETHAGAKMLTPRHTYQHAASTVSPPRRSAIARGTPPPQHQPGDR